MKLSTLLVLATILTGIAFHQTARADEQKWDFAGIEAGATAIQAEVSDLHDAGDLAFLQRLSAVVSRAGQEMQQRERDTAGMFRGKRLSAEMQTEQTDTRVRELQRRLLRVEEQLVSFHRIAAVMGELSSSWRGAVAQEVAGLLPELEARMHAKASELERTHRELARIAFELEAERERDARELRDRMDF